MIVDNFACTVDNFLYAVDDSAFCVLSIMIFSNSR